MRTVRTMSKPEIDARAKIAGLSDSKLLSAWNTTGYSKDPNIYTVRGWLMDEIEKRFPDAFNAWMDCAAPLEKCDLREGVEYWAICTDGQRRDASFVDRYVPGGVVFCVYPDSVNIIGYEVKED